MKETSKQYVVIDRETNQFLNVSTTFYKTRDIKEATTFKTEESANHKVRVEGIHFVVKYRVIKLTKEQLKEVKENETKKRNSKMAKRNTWKC